MRYLLSVSSRAVPGREADYGRWYEGTHVSEVLALPGFVACERFERLAPDGEAAVEHVAVYEIETGDPPALVQSLFAAAPDMEMTDALDIASARFEVLRPVGSGRRVAAA
jgi:predicted secreted Zn-dependent protease